jgi:hypothetical protein
MSNNQKWKDKLLSSSFPLEYEAMKLLAGDGFSVSSEFSYSRLDGDIRKDFSVDIDALDFTPFGNPNEVTSYVHFLVECKYRKVGTNWLFLPDPNNDEYSSFTLGQTIRAVDNFTKLKFSPNCVTSFDDKEELPFCLKGVEIDIVNSAAHDGQIKHGLSQLQYALPSMFERLITHSSFPMPDDAIPFFICPILLTSAPLFVANTDFSMSAVKDSNCIEDIAHEVPYLVTYQDISPEFTEHCQNEFESKLRFNLKHLEEIGNYRSSLGEYDFDLPINFIESLIQGRTSELKGSFTQYIVCNWDHFPLLIKDLKEAITLAMSSVESDS